MTDINNLLVIDLDFDNAIIIWPYDDAPKVFQKLNAAHVDGDNDWIVFIPSDLEYESFLKLGLSNYVDVHHMQGDSTVIVYKEKNYA